MSPQYDSFSDRITHVAANSQLVVAGLIVSLGIAIVWFRPSVPGVPSIVWGWFAALTLFGPPLLALFIQGARALRGRRMVEVHHVNAANDVLEKWLVAPEVWENKNIDGPSPYPVNGGGAWAVREFEYLEDTGELNVSGVWLSECEDTKLYTSKSHMNSIYSKLTESHIALGILRDSVSEFGADIQKKLVNSMSEARERGKMMDETATKEVFESFEDEATSLGADDLPTLEPDDLPDDPDAGGVEDGPDPLGDMADEAIGPQPAATDGGTDQ